MESVSIESIDLYDVGTKITMFGVIYEGHGKLFLAPFPDQDIHLHKDLAILPMSMEEWERWLNQSDVLDVRGPAKAILRKGQRHIDKLVSWEVFKRDGYRCRYCGKEGPLTVDHVVLWENGGASVAENLITACPKCNKLRGNMEYPDWMKSKEYYRVSRAITWADLKLNADVLNKLDSLKTISAKTRSR